MSNPTSNFNWQMPTPTDLVTDLPADFEVFGQAVDSTLADLKGGTSGQILSKNSNTDMDFVWITNDQGDITAVNVTSPITGGGTSGAVTVGIQSATTSQSGAVQLSDSTSTTSSVLAATPTAVKSAYDLAASAYAPAFTNNFFAGKNKFINGDFGIWQRGTSFSNVSTGTFTADRWSIASKSGTHTTNVTQQTFTPGTAPVSGYEGSFFTQIATTGFSSGDYYFGQKIENVRTFAGQTVTYSYWARVTSGTLIPARVFLNQQFGSGGSAEVDNIGVSAPTITTTWTRFTNTVTVPSISGKTIGTGSNLWFLMQFAPTGNPTLQLWGFQIEAGSVATPFVTASGNSPQAELAICQRYYTRWNATSTNSYIGGGNAYVTNTSIPVISFPVEMRVSPTSLDTSGVYVSDDATNYSGGTTTLAVSTTKNAQIRYVHGSSVLTQYRFYYLALTASTGYLGLSAEL